MDEEPTFKVITTGRGQQIPVLQPSGLEVSMRFSDDSIKDDVNLNVTEKQFGYIRKMAVTNDIPAAILKTNEG